MLTREDIEAMVEGEDTERETQYVSASLEFYEFYLSELQENVRAIKAYQEAFDKGDYR